MSRLDGKTWLYCRGLGCEGRFVLFDLMDVEERVLNSFECTHAIIRAAFHNQFCNSESPGFM